MAVMLNSINPIQSTFPEKDVLAPLQPDLASGVAISTLGKPLTEFKRMLNRQVKATRKIIAGHVMRVDNYGNLITNILKQDFDILSKGKPFTIHFGGEKSRRIHTDYHQVEQGDCFVLFNSLGLLEIGINKGNGSELLGFAI